MDLLTCLKNFKAVVDYNSFTKAAKAMNVNIAVLSKQIVWLEKYYDQTLLQRTTRRKELTPSGKLAYQLAEKWMIEVEKIKSEMRDKEAEPEGTLRISFPTSIDQAVMRCFDALIKKYPKIKLELEDVRSFDAIFDANLDLNIATFDINDPRLTKKELISLERGLYASPEYIKKHGTPKTCKDLMQHHCLVNRHSTNKNEWIFEKGKVFPVNCHLASKNQVNIIDAALLGLGICWSNKTVMKSSLESGSLVEVKLDKNIQSGQLYLYHLPSYRGALVQVASNFIEDYFNKRV